MLLNYHQDQWEIVGEEWPVLEKNIKKEDQQKINNVNNQWKIVREEQPMLEKTRK